MKAYFIRRLILLPITLLGITFLVFFITRIAPGGPADQLLMQAAATEDDGGGEAESEGGLDEEAIEELEHEHGTDKGIFHAYSIWLGVMPRENLMSKLEYSNENGRVINEEEKTESIRMVTKKEDRIVVITKEQGQQGKLISAVYEDDKKPISEAGWVVKIETKADRVERWLARNESNKIEDAKNYNARAVLYKQQFAGLVQGDLRTSKKYYVPVWEMIAERIPISLFYGILSFIITYAVCIPLGVVKAIKHRTFLDNFSSVLIFVGYSIPGFALGAALLLYFGLEHQIFPIGGFVSENFSELSFFGQVKDLLWHAVLPLICYVIGGFAVTTMMMKNNLMDNLAADYVRTAMAKGVNYRRAIIGHAFRNSIIPIATGLGGLVAVFVAGSMLIERVFDINGFGMMQFEAITGQDRPVIMGTLVIAAFLMLLGNILSDIIVALVDPRIKFN